MDDRLEIAPLKAYEESTGRHVISQAEAYLGMKLTKVVTSDIITVSAEVSSQEAEAIADYSSVSEPESGPSTLGDLLKEKMSDSE